MECSQQNMKDGQRAKDGMSGTTIMLRERDARQRRNSQRSGKSPGRWVSWGPEEETAGSDHYCHSL